MMKSLPHRRDGTVALSALREGLERSHENLAQEQFRKLLQTIPSLHDDRALTFEEWRLVTHQQSANTSTMF